MPVIVAAGVIPIFFYNSLKDLSNEDYPSSFYDPPQEVSNEEFEIQPNTQSLSIESDLTLDPVFDNVFIVSFFLKLKALPVVNVRHNIVEKYQRQARVHSGWAIGVKTFATSFSRFEVFWLDLQGRGGWFTFNSYPMQVDQWYALTLLAVPSKNMQLYLQPVFSPDGVNSDVSPVFLGGYSLKDLSLPQSPDNLKIGVIRQKEKEFKGEVSHLLIANIEKSLINLEQVPEIINGGPSKLFSSINLDDISLWMKQYGIDESRHRRKIK